MVDSEDRSRADGDPERPDWWRRAAAEFDRHGLRPYRPPRFRDGTLKHEVVDRLEAEYGVEITFVCFDPDPGDSWEVRVDGATACEVGHHRHRAGYSVFEITAEAFESSLGEWIEANR